MLLTYVNQQTTPRYLKKNQNEITTAFRIIAEFGIHSGLKLNKNKTEGLWLGRLKHSNLLVNNIIFSKDFIKTLGIYFGHNHEICSSLFFGTDLKLSTCMSKIRSFFAKLVL